MSQFVEKLKVNFEFRNSLNISTSTSSAFLNHLVVPTQCNPKLNNGVSQMHCYQLITIEQNFMVTCNFNNNQ